MESRSRMRWALPVLAGALVLPGCTGDRSPAEESVSLPEAASSSPTPSPAASPSAEPTPSPSPSPVPAPPVAGDGTLTLSAVAATVTGDCTLWGMPAEPGPVPPEAQVLVGVTNRLETREGPDDADAGDDGDAGAGDRVAVSLRATGAASPMTVRVDGGPDPEHRAFEGTLEGARLDEVEEVDGVAIGVLQVAGTVSSAPAVPSLPAPQPAPPPPSPPASPTTTPTPPPSPSPTPGEPAPVAPPVPSPPVAVEVAFELACRVLP